MAGIQVASGKQTKPAIFLLSASLVPVPVSTETMNPPEYTALYDHVKRMFLVASFEVVSWDELMSHGSQSEPS